MRSKPASVRKPTAASMSLLVSGNIPSPVICPAPASRELRDKESMPRSACALCGSGGEKMTKGTVNLKQHWTIAAGLSFSPMGKEQRVDEETVAGSEPDQLLVRAGQRSVSGHAAASQTAHPTIALQCRKALCACR